MEAALGQMIAEVMKYGLPGVGLLGMTFLYWYERKDRKEAQDGRLSDQKILHELLASVRVSMESTEKALEALTNELRRRP